MDETELEEDLSAFYRTLFTESEYNTEESPQAEIQAPDPSVSDEVMKILKQRSSQRDKVLKFVLRLTEDVVVLFIVLVFFKIAFKVTMNIDVLSDGTLDIIGTAMFVEIIAVVHSISKALWSEKDILNAPIIEKIRSSSARHKSS